MPDPYERMLDIAVSHAELAGVVERISDKVEAIEKERDAEKKERDEAVREQRRRAADRFEHRWDWVSTLGTLALGGVCGGILHWFVKNVLRIPIP